MADGSVPSTSASMTDVATAPQPANPAEPEFKVYKPPRTGPSLPHDLPDSYFTPTAADLRAAQASLANRTQALVNAPLQGRAVRDAKEKAQRERWPNTTIRVKFSDRTQLEKTFPSTNKIRSVYAFVRSSLREDVKPIKFILYQSPPKRDLKVSDPTVRELTLAELQLAPSSILLLRFEDDSLNGSAVRAPLCESILARAVDLPIPVSPDDPRATSTGAPVPPKKLNPAADGKNPPKWFKMGPKK